MPLKKLVTADSIEEGVQKIIPYLEATGKTTADTAIYLDGWDGLAASAVLRAIAEDPPPSLRERFDKIIHIDCSRWKSRRVLQRTIVEQLKLPPHVMAVLDRRDEDEDFSGVDEGSRAELEEITWEIFHAIGIHTFLVLFHNGSDSMVDLTDFGMPLFNLFSPNKLLWTFRGRLRLNPGTSEKVDEPHLYLYYGNRMFFTIHGLFIDEAREILQHSQYKQQGITPETAAKCFVYVLWLKWQQLGSSSSMDYNWATQASNYWVCDGIIEEGQTDKAWEDSDALLEELRIEDMTTRQTFHLAYEEGAGGWLLFTYTSESGEMTQISPIITSYFLAVGDNQVCPPLHNHLFQKSERLRVLKLSGCSFSFYSPPFRCCRGLRFLGLDCCSDQQREEEEEEEERKQGRPAMEFFWSLWVLDINDTDWELDLSPEDVNKMAENIRDVHVRNGRIWGNNLSWRKLQNIRKLRVIKPTRSWETGNKDEFHDMVKMELLDLSGNITIHALPSLSGATGLKTLVLDGCVGLEQVGHEDIPPSLESFSFDATMDHPAKLSKISLAGCVHLKIFLLRGALPALEELNLSGTSIKKLDLRDPMVEVPRLKKIFLMGCRQLRVVLWWTEPRSLEVVRIDTLGRNEDDSVSSSHLSIQHKHYHAYVVAGDARFIQSLMTYDPFVKPFVKAYNNLYVDLHAPPYSSIGSLSSTGSSRVAVANPRCYSDVLLEDVAASDDDDEVPRPPPPGCHVDVGEGINLRDVETHRGIDALSTLIEHYSGSLHVHDNSCMLDVMPKLLKSQYYTDFKFKWCHVERCPNLQAVFAAAHSVTNYWFQRLEKIWASDLLAAHCIWSKGIVDNMFGSFKALERIHIHNCPRLKFVLPFKSGITLPKLEALHITCCGDLRQVFPWDDDDMPPSFEKEGAVKEFPELKQIHLHDVPNLQEICEAKMYAPILESVRIRGCWGLRRLPAVGRDRDRPVVHCEKDCWEKLKWDGLESGHHASLYEPHYSSVYHRKRLLRGTVLR